MLKINLKTLCARLLAGVATAAIGAGAALAQVESTDLSLPPQLLADSLTDLSMRTGENILFQPESMVGVRAPALKGHLTPQQAVQKLIEGTGLRADSDGRGGIIVRRESLREPERPLEVPIQHQEPYVQLAQAAPQEVAAAPQDRPADIEQVIVSASRITIAGYSAPTPVTVLGSAQLAQDAYANIIDSISILPQVVTPPSSFSTSQGNSASGTAGTNLVNLRDLGYVRTLVLFDSQRVVASNIAGGVDVTTLPSVLISRVDIVTGGASAAWGSDAVAGVVNFVLNKNFTGFKASVQGSDTSNGLDRGLSLQSAWGDDVFGGRGHIEVAGNVNINPDTVDLTQENWFRGSYFVSNPAYAAGNGQPQLVVANNVGVASSTMGGIINSNPSGTAAGSANVLRGIEFVGAGTPQLVNYGNVTLGTLSNGGSLTTADTVAAWIPIANPSNTYTFFGYGRYKLTDNILASVQLNYGYVTSLSESPGAPTTVTVRSDNAFLPASVIAVMQSNGITSFTLGTLDGNNFNNNTATGANFYNQAEDALEPGTIFNRRQLMRGVFNLDGTIGDDWSWSAYIQHSAVQYSVHSLGVAITANETAAEDAVAVTAANRGTSNLPLGSIACRSTLTGAAVTVAGVTALPGCIPLDVFGTGVASQAAISYITGASNNATTFEDQILGQTTAEGSMQGTLPWQLPAGKIAVVFGAGYREETGQVTTSDNAISAYGGYNAGSFSAYPNVSYSVWEGFGEVDAPILKDSIVNSLDFSMAGRMTSYSTSGLVETWKLGATSQVNDDIKLRTTWSVDIRAPQLSDLYNPGGFAANTSKDPKTQLTVATLQDTTGNPNLLPEVAHTVSGGVVLTPSFIPGLSLSGDWYYILLKGVITSLSASTILNQCDAQLPSAIYPGQNGNPNDPLCTHLVFNGPGGALSAINLTEINLASQTTSGLDLQANYITDFWDGSLSLVSTASYNDENTITQPGAGTNDFAGSNDLTGQASLSPGPKWRGVLAATYTTGPYSFTAQTRWFGTSVSYQNGNTGNQSSAATANLYEQAYFELPVVAYLDLRGSYKWNDNIQFYGAVDNAFDTPPPLLAPLSSVTSATKTDFRTNINVYDMLGRIFRVGVRFNY